MKLLLSTLGVIAALTLCAPANVVRPAPDLGFEGVGKSSLKAALGQPVVLVIANSADSSAFRKQLKRLKETYQEFAARDVIFVAALADPSGIIRSDIPFTLAKDGAAVAAAYGVEKGFAIVIVGKDGNMDLISSEVIPASRVRDVLINSYSIQAPARK